MIFPIEIYSKNFAGLNDFTYTFNSGCYAVNGVNHDKEGQGSNGSGKSSFLDVLPICIIGDSGGKRNVKTYINRGGKSDNFIVGCKLSDGSDIYEIRRKIFKSSKASILSISKNGESLKDVPSKASEKFGVDTKEGNKFILDLLGISKNDLVSYYFINSGQYKPFFEKPDSEILLLIDRMAGTGVVNEAINIVKDDISNIEKVKSDIDKMIIKYQSSIETLKLMIVSSDDAHKNKEKYLKEISSLKKELIENDLKISKVGNLITPNKNTENIEKIVSEIEKIDVQIFDLKSKISDLTSMLQITSSCPNCDYKYSLNSDVNLEEISNRLNVSKSKLDILVQDKDNLVDQLKIFKLEDQKNAKLEKLLIDLKNEDLNINSKIKDLERSLLDIKSTESKNDEILSKIDDDKGELSKLVDRKNKYTIMYDELNAWGKDFEKFKFFLIKKPIEAIQSNANAYLNMIGSLMYINIELEKEKRDRSTKQTINAIIIDENGDKEPYCTYSGGEKVRINIAIELAIQGILNINSGFGYYSNDEALNPLDATGMVNICKAFDKVGYPIFFATHSGSEIKFDKSVLIERKDQKGVVKIKV